MRLPGRCINVFYNPIIILSELESLQQTITGHSQLILWYKCTNLIHNASFFTPLTTPHHQTALTPRHPRQTHSCLPKSKWSLWLPRLSEVTISNRKRSKNSRTEGLPRQTMYRALIVGRRNENAAKKRQNRPRKMLQALYVDMPLFLMEIYVATRPKTVCKVEVTDRV